MVRKIGQFRAPALTLGGALISITVALYVTETPSLHMATSIDRSNHWSSSLWHGSLRVPV